MFPVNERLVEIMRKVLKSYKFPYIPTLETSNFSVLKMSIHQYIFFLDYRTFPAIRILQSVQRQYAKGMSVLVLAINVPVAIL